MQNIYLQGTDEKIYIIKVIGSNKMLIANPIFKFGHSPQTHLNKEISCSKLEKLRVKKMLF